MGALGHRALLQYIDSNDLAGFKAYLDTRNLAVDDRDEVMIMNYRINPLPFTYFNIFFTPFPSTEWSNGAVGGFS